MKKNYMKPEANEIEVASNQAIAACYKLAKGYQNLWTQSGEQFAYPTYEAARAAHGSPDAPVCPVYYVEGDIPEQGTVYGTFRDWNYNGKMDGIYYELNGVGGTYDEKFYDQKGDVETLGELLNSGAALMNS